MITHAQYHAEMPLPNFPAPLDINIKMRPLPTNMSEKSLPKHVMVRMATLEVARIDKFRFMSGRGRMSVTQIAAELQTIPQNIYTQLQRLTKERYINKFTAPKPVTYEWSDEL